MKRKRERRDEKISYFLCKQKANSVTVAKALVLFSFFFLAKKKKSHHIKLR